MKIMLIQVVSIIVLIVAALGCMNSPKANNPVVSDEINTSKPDSFSCLWGQFLQHSLNLETTDGFDFPVGKPNAKGYYNAQKFGENVHLGEDWNGTGGGNSDLGDPVYAVATGMVVSANDAGPGWGNVVRIGHKMKSGKEIESLYAHLDTMLVKPGDLLRRGDQIGTIGNADGAYWAHLHFEMRHTPCLPLGGGYSADTTGFLIPTDFIRKNRPK